MECGGGAVGNKSVNLLDIIPSGHISDVLDN